MCEETKGLIFGKTQLERLCYTEALLGCSWTAGWDGRPRRGRPEHIRNDLHPVFPKQECLSRETESTEEKTCKNSDIWGFPKEKAKSPWPLHSTTHQLSGAAWAALSICSLTDSEISADGKGTSGRGEMLQHERNKPKPKEKRSSGEKEKPPVNLIT